MWTTTPHVFHFNTTIAKRNITDERETLIQTLTKWEQDGLEKGKKGFGSGLDQPDLGDLAMYGVIHSVSGLRAHEEVILGRGGVVLDWYQRMEMEVEAGR